jgi:hypothetical protein
MGGWRVDILVSVNAQIHEAIEAYKKADSLRYFLLKKVASFISNFNELNDHE